jgi:hypothetical protein
MQDTTAHGVLLPLSRPGKATANYSATCKAANETLVDRMIHHMHRFHKVSDDESCIL